MTSKTKAILGAVVILAASAFLSSCGNKRSLKTQPVETLSIELGFQDVLSEVITNNCLECHKTYSDHQIAASLSGRMLSRIEAGTMPPQGKTPLSTRAKQVFATWVSNGSPLEAGGAAAKEVPLEPTFDSLLVNFFAPKCAACHTGASDAPAPSHLDFTSYEGMIASNELYEVLQGELLLNKDFPEDSPLIFSVIETRNPRDPDAPVRPPFMPPAIDFKGVPAGYVKPDDATDKEIEVLTEWIRRGFPKN